MKDVLDANLVMCPGENAYLDPTATEWVRNRAKAGIWPKPRALELCMSVEWPHGRRFIRIFPIGACPCCGKHAYQANLTLVDHGPPPQWRCDVHVGRNPCLVPGCGQTRDGKRPRVDSYLCSRHWRMVPRAMRDVHNRIWRLQRRSGGWTDTLVARELRLWSRITREAIERSRGKVDLDIAEIEKLFGL